MPDRPQRMRVIGDLETPRTLPGGAEQFRELHRPRGAERAALVLGIGPEPEVLERDLGLAGRLNYYMEAPEFLGQAGKGYMGSLSRSWIYKDLGWLMGLRADELGELRIIQYAPGARVFPSFWGPILGRIRTLLAGAMPGQAATRRVLLPGEENGLLLRELAQAFGQAGWDVDRVETARGRHPDPAALAEQLASAPADLYFSVNFQGLDAYGEVHHVLDQAGCSVAAWCVDNPWHLISGLKAGFWRAMHLFVTDRALARDLEQHGAERAHHLPLAASPTLFKARGYKDPGLESRVAFVGRSEFPGKAGFFAGMRVDQPLMDQALEMLDAGQRPDFLWWAARLGIEERWPDKAVRKAGLGAEESGLHHRSRCLQAAAQALDITVFGDTGWSQVLGPDSDLRPPVDYYGGLPEIYGSARACLNMTSLLLPAGLTQRHFDVWLAGGLLLSDATPGLDIFPRELADPIYFTRPREIAEVLERIEVMAGKGAELRAAWLECILAEHTYAQRVQTILEVLSLDRSKT